MNKNKVIKRCLVAVAALSVTAVTPSCDYLAVVPDNTATLDDAFESREMAERYLHTCYSYQPRPMYPEQSFDIYSAGEAFGMQDGSGAVTLAPFYMMAGDQNVVNPYYNTWDGENGRTVRAYYKAIRDCNIFLEYLDDNSAHEYPFDLDEADRKRWVAEVKYLKALYHFYLLRQYGAITIMDKNQPTNATAEEFRLHRNTFKECVDYIDNLMLSAAASEYVPYRIEMETSELGRLTKPMMYAMYAKFRVTVASPLFNGNAILGNVVDNRGIKIFEDCVNYDKEKWTIARKAVKAAIDTAMNYGGADLLRSSQAPTSLGSVMQRDFNLRQIISQSWNVEHIWGGTNGDVPQATLDAFPRFNQEANNAGARNRLAPTMDMANSYYTERGLPIDEDVQFLAKDWYEFRQPDPNNPMEICFIARDNSNNDKNGGTIELHYGREPRFYANILCDNFYLWGSGKTPSVDDAGNNRGSMWQVQSKMGQVCGLNAWEYFSITGYHCKKWIMYQTTFNNSLVWKYNDAPVIRLADLYLLYAECLNEEGDAAVDDILYWVNLVRERADIPTVQESWGAANGWTTAPDKFMTQEGRREIIKRERKIELAFEGHHLWDMLRWKDAKDAWNGKPIEGWNVKGTTAADFYRVTVCPHGDRVFQEKNYLWPFKESTLDRNTNIVQNYGW